MVFVYFLASRDFKLNYKMPGYAIYFFFLITALCIGLFYHSNEFYIIFKQLYYFIMVFLYWYIGRQEAITNKINISKFYTSIVFFSIFYCIYDLFLIMQNIKYLGSLDLNSFRMQIGTGSLIPVLSLYLLVSVNTEISLSKQTKSVSLFLFLLSILAHFSRTSLLVLLVLFLFSGIKFWTFKWFKYVVFVLAGVLVSYFAFPVLFDSFLGKILNTFTELGFKTSSWDNVTITQNWRGYEVACALQQFRNGSLFQQVFGSGFGTTLDAQGYAYLVSSEDTLSFLHNGYYTQLLIWGVNGVVLLIVWFICFFRQSSKLTIKEKGFVRGMTVVIAIVTYFIMGPFFNNSLSLFYYFMGVMFTIGKYDTKDYN